MIYTKVLKKIEDFENLNIGDDIACEFHRNVHDHPTTYRFKVFKIVEIKKHTKEIILQKKNNIYFNYEMFINGESNLSNAVLITHD